MKQFLLLVALFALLVLAAADAIWPAPQPLLIDGPSANPAVLPTTASAPVTPRALAAEPKVIKPPIDRVGRAKWPNEDSGIVDGLGLVNKAINQMIKYADDGDHYGVAQLMVSWPPDLKGDCEDYALTKLVMIEDAGLPIVEYARLRFVYAPSPLDGRMAGHALLEVRMPKGGIAFLDNNFNELMTRAELEARGYQFFNW